MSFTDQEALAEIFGPRSQNIFWRSTGSLWRHHQTHRMRLTEDRPLTMNPRYGPGRYRSHLTDGRVYTEEQRRNVARRLIQTIGRGFLGRRRAYWQRVLQQPNVK